MTDKPFTEEEWKETREMGVEMIVDLVSSGKFYPRLFATIDYLFEQNRMWRKMADAQFDPGNGGR